MDSIDPLEDLMLSMSENSRVVSGFSSGFATPSFSVSGAAAEIQQPVASRSSLLSQKFATDLLHPPTTTPHGGELSRSESPFSIYSTEDDTDYEDIRFSSSRTSNGYLNHNADLTLSSSLSRGISIPMARSHHQQQAFASSYDSHFIAKKISQRPKSFMDSCVSDVDDEQQTQQQQQQKRERNRLAAERCRRKKNQMIESLTSKCEALEREKEMLAERNRVLEEKLVQLIGRL